MIRSFEFAVPILAEARRVFALELLVGPIKADFGPGASSKMLAFD